MLEALLVSWFQYCILHQMLIFVTNICHQVLFWTAYYLNFRLCMIQIVSSQLLIITYLTAETNDPQKSRVIIFSNFRGSVRCHLFSVFNLLLFYCFWLQFIYKMWKIFLAIMKQTYRDIMDALANIGNFVRATEFIGQSSGLKLHSLFWLVSIKYNF